MKYLFIIFLLSTCGLPEEEAPLTINFKEDVFLWDKKDLPLDFGCDSNFSDKEKLFFEDAIDQWEQATQTDLFNELKPIENPGFLNLSDYYYKDSKMGIYKSDNPVIEILPEHLAACQVKVEYSHNIDTKKVFHIKHADIVFNYKDHTFKTELDDRGFDLPSVFLHEVGHVLGLRDRDSGVMAGTMTIDEIRRELSPDLEDEIFNLYNNSDYDCFNREPAQEPYPISKNYKITFFMKKDRTIEKKIEQCD